MDWTGPASKLIIGTETELIRVLIEPANPNVDAIDGLEITGIGLERLGILYLLVKEREGTPTHKSRVPLTRFGSPAAAIPLVSAGGTEMEDVGPWLFRLPDDLVKILARTDDAGLEELGRLWAQACPPPHPLYEAPLTPVELVGALHGIQRLAKHAADEHKPVHLWMSNY